MASRIDNEKASTDVDDSRWEGYDISSSEDEYEVPSSDDDDSIFGDPVSESDNMDIDDEDSISDTHDEPTSENTSDVVVIRNSELTYYGDSDLEDFAYKEDVPEQSKSLEGGFHSCQNLNAKAKKIKDHQKSRIMSLGAAGMRLFNIMRSFISDSGKYSTVGFVRKDLYNMSCREKMKMIAKGDANTTIGIMEKRKRDDPEFFFDYKLGKGGKLLHLFWCDSQSRQDYADFGDVLVFDSTYKTNRNPSNEIFSELDEINAQFLFCPEASEHRSAEGALVGPDDMVARPRPCRATLWSRRLVDPLRRLFAYISPRRKPLRRKATIREKFQSRRHREAKIGGQESVPAPCRSGEVPRKASPSTPLPSPPPSSSPLLLP
ncbi:hypothetical protein QYE76_047015 [Lolium multiflorum]|uniref:Protein FAR1-RELATED SEQUENCE n=1 Tax=Lolium multiflorum TaxID=4521 RepID=A0AAD8TQX7_LOLMU|nr:hypothetical protein QYE76_047015 [Lolium multiflorum]